VQWLQCCCVEVEGVRRREGRGGSLLTASWLEKQSQIPSQAIMKNLSSGNRVVTVTSGSALMICTYTGTRASQ
jgi:hypothetical protein